VPNLTYLGIKARLHELFAADPTLVNVTHPKLGHTPLFALPDDEEEALEMTEFLLAHGADRTITNKDGRTAEQVARQRGLIEAADLMRAPTNMQYSAT
jgi:ankyrin repeat protein